ncbi:MAG: hypothetical protein ACRCYO_09325, partial [Bacteroidia bacterium]
QDAIKRAKANKASAMEIFETTNIFDAEIATYDDLISIIKNLPLKFPEGHAEMIDDINAKFSAAPATPSSEPLPKEIKLLEAIENHLPKTDGLLERLDKKDKQLREHYDLQNPFRQGFMLAEEIVKQWAKENYGI